MQELQCVQYRVFGAKESKFSKIDVVRLSNMAEIQDGGQNGAQIKFSSMRLARFIMQELQCVQYRFFLGPRNPNLAKSLSSDFPIWRKFKDGGQNAAVLRKN